MLRGTVFKQMHLKQSLIYEGGRPSSRNRIPDNLKVPLWNYFYSIQFLSRVIGQKRSKYCNLDLRSAPELNINCFFFISNVCHIGCSFLFHNIYTKKKKRQINQTKNQLHNLVSSSYRLELFQAAHP